MCENKPLITINYVLADGTVIQIDVTMEVAVALSESDHKMLALLKQDQRYLDFAGYMDGQTE